MKKLLALSALLAVAGFAPAQCPNGQCPVPAGFHPLARFAAPPQCAGGVCYPQGIPQPVTPLPAAVPQAMPAGVPTGSVYQYVPQLGCHAWVHPLPAAPARPATVAPAAGGRVSAKAAKLGLTLPGVREIVAEVCDLLAKDGPAYRRIALAALTGVEQLTERDLTGVLATLASEQADIAQVVADLRAAFGLAAP